MDVFPYNDPGKLYKKGQRCFCNFESKTLVLLVFLLQLFFIKYEIYGLVLHLHTLRSEVLWNKAVLVKQQQNLPNYMKINVWNF